MNVQIDEILEELEKLGSERTKKIYKAHGAQEPFFGVATGAMKPLAKKIKKNHALSMQLYETNTYDAMYLAGMVADPIAMSEDDFEQWMKRAYFYMLSDYVVAVSLAESPLAQEVADKWIKSGQDLYMSAGWSCYCWLVGIQKDDAFDKDKIQAMLQYIKETIHSQPNRTKYAMNTFVSSFGISYLPLHEEARSVAQAIGKVDVEMNGTSCKTPLASDYIQRAIDRNKLGFKRKNVRC